MRRIVLLFPIALLAACSNQPNTDNGAPANPAEMPEPAMMALANARTATDWTGTYMAIAADGGRTALTLKADNSYALATTAADGTHTAVSGWLQWQADGGRFHLDSAGGDTTYAVGDGVIFRLPAADAPATGPLPRDSALLRMNVGMDKMMPGR